MRMAHTTVTSDSQREKKREKGREKRKDSKDRAALTYTAGACLIPEVSYGLWICIQRLNPREEAAHERGFRTWVVSQEACRSGVVGLIDSGRPAGAGRQLTDDATLRTGACAATA